MFFNMFGNEFGGEGDVDVKGYWLEKDKFDILVDFVFIKELFIMF